MDVLHFDPFKGDNEVAAADKAAANTDKAAWVVMKRERKLCFLPPTKGNGRILFPPSCEENRRVSKYVNEMNQEQAWRAIAEAALATKPAGKEEKQDETPDPRKIPSL